MKPLMSGTFRIAIIFALLLFIAGAGSCQEKAAEKVEQAPVVEQKAMPAAPPEAKIEKDAFVAIVNDVSIPADDLDRKMEMVKNRYSGMGVEMDANQMADMRKRITDSLVEQEILYQESVAQNIAVDQAEIDSELQNFKRQFTSDADFQAQITEMGYTEDSLKKEIQRAKSIQHLIEQKIVAGITIAEADLKAHYDANPDNFKVPERVHARHILAKIGQGADETEKAEARKKIEAVKEKLNSGEDFAKLASENSDCPSSKNGGDLDFFAKGQMVKPFEDAAFAMNPGEISDIVETQFGYHIIKVEGKEPAGTVSFEDAKEGLAEKLKNQKARESVTAYIASLKEKAKIQYPGQ